jgi:hypothetical protein
MGTKSRIGVGVITYIFLSHIHSNMLPGATSAEVAEQNDPPEKKAGKE